MKPAKHHKMVRKIAADLLYQFELHYEAGSTADLIARETGIPRRTVFRLIRNMNFWGTPYPPKEIGKGCGRERRLTEDILK
jgi:hypothetical protein